MKILLLSDSHGKIDNALRVYRSLEDIDVIVHLGDYARDAKALSRELRREVFSVAGNCDGHYAENGYKILETDFGRIFVAHGHVEGVKHGLQNLIYKAESLGCKAAFFGHTHLPYYREMAGFYLLNPGSITLPGMDGRVSYAVAEAGKEGFKAAILYTTL
jgi:hypothetical protein